jgi:hypothetical protein
MKPVYQTKFGKPGGNCFPACVASILELRLEDVPDVCNDYPEYPDPSPWLVAFADWLRPRGLDFMLAALDNTFPPWWTMYWIAGGPQKRTGIMHAVVYKGQEQVHDPNPRSSGLSTIANAMFLVPRDISEWSRANDRAIA